MFTQSKDPQDLFGERFTSHEELIHVGILLFRFKEKIEELEAAKKDLIAERKHRMLLPLVTALKKIIENYKNSSRKKEQRPELKETLDFVALMMGKVDAVLTNEALLPILNEPRNKNKQIANNAVYQGIWFIPTIVVTGYVSLPMACCFSVLSFLAARQTSKSLGTDNDQADTVTVLKDLQAGLMKTAHELKNEIAKDKKLCQSPIAFKS